MGKDCCYNCQKRHFNCHSNCREHKERKEQDALEHKLKEKDRMLNDYNGINGDRLRRLVKHSPANNKGMVHRDSSVTVHPNNDLDIEYDVD